MNEKWKCDVCKKVGGQDEIYEHIRKDHRYPKEDAALCCSPVSNEQPPIVVSIQQDLKRGPSGDVWAWSAWLGKDPQSPAIGIGYGHDYDSAAKLAGKAVRKYLKSVGQVPVARSK